jgi:DNA-binding MarR family transcriptional regulator
VGVATVNEPAAHPRLDLDPNLLHGVRMSLVAFLADADRVRFSFVRDALQVSDAELSRQASILERVGYLRIHKGHAGKRPRTWLKATDAGRQALSRHVDALERIAASGTRLNGAVHT